MILYHRSSLDLDDSEGSFTRAQETAQEEYIETAEAHQKSHPHLQKENEFHQYKDLYMAEVYPCLMKEVELLKIVDDLSSSGEKRRIDSVSLDLERLERCSSTVKREVQNIESSLNWTNTRALLKAVEELKAELQRTDKVFEQAKTDSLTDDYEEEEETEEGKDRNEEDEANERLMDIKEKKEKRRRKPNKGRKR